MRQASGAPDGAEEDASTGPDAGQASGSDLDYKVGAVVASVCGGTLTLGQHYFQQILLSPVQPGGSADDKEETLSSSSSAEAETDDSSEPERPRRRSTRRADASKVGRSAVT